MMSKEEMGRLALIKGFLDGKYTVGLVAVRLGLSTRQVKKLRRAVREGGDEAIIHGNSGRHPANYTSDDLRQKIIRLKQNDMYAETNVTHFRELLLEREHIEIGYTTLSTILKGTGIVSKKKHRTGGQKFRRRKRRSAFGEMLQADATPFDWFGSGTRHALHGFIDDATGRLVGLYMCQNECLQGYLEGLRQLLTKYGVPLDLYTDKAGLFFVNGKKPEHWTLDEQLAGKPLDKTQFGAIADELGINLIPANTPQAKGRIERVWGTLQDRLITQLKIMGIKNMEQFNANAAAIMDWFNNRFAKEPESAETSFVPLDEKNNLDTLLAVKHERTTDTCGCFSFQNLKFEVVSKKALFKKKIVFMFSERLGFRALYNKTYYPVRPLDFLNNAQSLPEVTKSLLFTFYLEDGKTNPHAHAVRGVN